MCRPAGTVQKADPLPKASRVSVFDLFEEARRRAGGPTAVSAIESSVTLKPVLTRPDVDARFRCDRSIHRGDVGPDSEAKTPDSQSQAISSSVPSPSRFARCQRRPPSWRLHFVLRNSISSAATSSPAGASSLKANSSPVGS